MRHYIISSRNKNTSISDHKVAIAPYSFNVDDAKALGICKHSLKRWERILQVHDTFSLFRTRFFQWDRINWMNIHCMLLSRKPKGSVWASGITSTHSLGFQKKMESWVGPRHHLGLYWLGELQWDMVLEAPQVRIVWNGLFVTNYHNIRGSFKPASFSLVLTDNNRTPAGPAWARLPTNHTASVRTSLWPLGLCILPDLWLWHFEKCFGDFQPHSLWVVSPYPLPLMSCMLSPWAVSLCSWPVC